MSAQIYMVCQKPGSKKEVALARSPGPNQAGTYCLAVVLLKNTWRSTNIKPLTNALTRLHNATAMTLEELKAARKRLGLTQEALAHALGMQKNSITRMEMGIQRIMRTTELSVKYLLLTMSKKEKRKK